MQGCGGERVGADVPSDVLEGVEVGGDVGYGLVVLVFAFSFGGCGDGTVPMMEVSSKARKLIRIRPLRRMMSRAPLMRSSFGSSLGFLLSRSDAVGSGFVNVDAGVGGTALVEVEDMLDHDMRGCTVHELTKNKGHVVADETKGPSL